MPELEEVRNPSDLIDIHAALLNAGWPNALRAADIVQELHKTWKELAANGPPDTMRESVNKAIRCIDKAINQLAGKQGSQKLDAAERWIHNLRMRASK